MAGTLVISNLSDGTDTTSSTNAIKGSAKAWVNFNGTTSPGTIRASYNVSSVTKSATGTYQAVLTTALADVNYAAVAGSGYVGDWRMNARPNTTTAVDLICRNGSNAAVDVDQLYLAIFR